MLGDPGRGEQPAHGHPARSANRAGARLSARSATGEQSAMDAAAGSSGEQGLDVLFSRGIPTAAAWRDSQRIVEMRLQNAKPTPAGRGLLVAAYSRKAHAEVGGPLGVSRRKVFLMKRDSDEPAHPTLPRGSLPDQQSPREGHRRAEAERASSPVGSDRSPRHRQRTERTLRTRRPHLSSRRPSRRTPPARRIRIGSAWRPRSRVNGWGDSSATARRSVKNT